MKTMKTFLSALLILLGVALAAPASAQVGFTSRVGDAIIGGETAGGAITAVGQDTAFVIRYIGPAASGEVAVAANGNITLTVGGAADTSTECPISGGLGGVIVVSDASCDTLGEVLNTINFSPNWRAFPVDGKLSDDMNGGGSGALVSIGATAANNRNGLALKWDTPITLKVRRAMLAPQDRDNINYVFTNAGSQTGSYAIIQNPFKNSRTALFDYTETITSTGGAANIILKVYSLKPSFVRGRVNAAGTGFDGSTEQETLIYTAQGGATTVNKEFNQFLNLPLFSDKGGYLLTELSAATDLTAPLISAYGLQYKFDNGQ